MALWRQATTVPYAEHLLARARNGSLPGSRAHLSAGLDGADWWVAGPAVARADDAEVELDEVLHFLTAHGLLPSATHDA